MKLIKKLGFVCLVILISACKSDDDSIGGPLGGGLDVATLLTTGIWYQEAIAPDGITDCEKNTNINFTINGDVFIEMYDDEDGPCEFTGSESGVYTLTNDRDVIITSDNLLVTFVIDLITLELLVITTDEGETLTFDRNQG